VDNTAHLGGLATGFLSGLLLYGRQPITSNRRGIARRLAAAVGLFIGLGLATRAIALGIAGRADIRQASHSTGRAVDSYNQLIASMRQPLENSDQVSSEMNRLLARVQKTDAFLPGDGAMLDRLVDQVRSELEVLEKAPRSDPELSPMLDAFVSGERELREALKMIKAAYDHPDVGIPCSSDSLGKKIVESNRAFEQMARVREVYIQSHGLMVTH